MKAERCKYQERNEPASAPGEYGQEKGALAGVNRSNPWNIALAAELSWERGSSAHGKTPACTPVAGQLLWNFQ